MKLNTLRLALIILVTTFVLSGCSYTNELGSRQNDERVIVAEREIDRLNDDIKLLNNNIKVEADSSKKVSLKRQISQDILQLSSLQSKRGSIVLRYIASSGIPTELSRQEKEDRERANYLRRQEMVIKKIENNLTNEANGSLSNNGGYKVILENSQYRPIVFKICPVDGGEETSVYLSADERQEIYLIPGSYSVHTLADGQEVCNNCPLNINGKISYFRGEKCYGFVCR